MQTTLLFSNYVLTIKASSYIAQYPVLRTAQNTLHFTSLTDMFNQTPSRLLWEASSHMLQLMREGCSYTYPPLSIARYAFIQLSELEHCRVKKLAQGFNTAAQDSNPGSLSRESEALPLSNCALHIARTALAISAQVFLIARAEGVSTQLVFPLATMLAFCRILRKPDAEKFINLLPVINTVSLTCWSNLVKFQNFVLS